MSIAYRVQDYLEERELAWDPVTHPWSGSCMEAARLAHVPPDRVAKAVVLKGPSRYVMAVIPANHQLHVRELGQALGEDLALVHERSLAGLFGDCESGAIPPLGTAYGMATLWDEALARRPDVYFEGGDHRTLVHMDGGEFRQLMLTAQALPPATH